MFCSKKKCIIQIELLEKMRKEERNIFFIETCRFIPTTYLSSLLVYFSYIFPEFILRGIFFSIIPVYYFIISFIS